MEALRQIDAWPARRAVAAVVWEDGRDEWHGLFERDFPWASVTKIATALATLVAAEEGVVDLDEPAGPEGSTVRHLLAHASGLGPDAGPPLAAPGRRRIYSNHGFEVLADHVGRRAEMRFGEYLNRALPGIPVLTGSAASGAHGTIRDLIQLARFLLRPGLLAAETLAEATEVQFPGLVGVLPGFGRQEPNDWGLGLELRDAKNPHWTGSRNSPRTFGHFGQTGTFLWVDPDAGVALACLTDLAFGDWAKEAWPKLADAVLAEARGAT